MLELGEAQRFRGGSDAIIVPVEVIADRVNRAPNLHVRHGGHHYANLEVVSVTCLESTLLTFAHLVMIPCIHEMFFHEVYQQRESGLRDKAAETVHDEDAMRVDTGQFSEREVERRGASVDKVQQSGRSGTAQCFGEARSGAAVVCLRIVAFATRRGRSAARDATTPITRECDRVVSTSRQQESSSNCASSVAGGTTSRRPRTDRVVCVFSRLDQTGQRASESNARGPRGGCVCMRSRPDGAALTKRVVSQKYVLFEFDSSLVRTCESESVEHIFAVGEYTEPRLQSFREDR